MRNAVESNGIAIVRTHTGIGVAPTRPFSLGPVKVEVDYAGRRLKNELLSFADFPWRDFYPGLDMLRCVVRVKHEDRVLAELDSPEAEREIMPFMRRQGEQHHVTEAYCSVPPCLTLTDELGSIWTLGFQTATKEQSPEGEFAFPVLRDGVNVREIASRIERRNGRIRVLTKSGWKVWTGQSFF